MKTYSEKRARDEAFLHQAMEYAHFNNMNELDMFEMLTHVLLDIKDEAYQEKLKYYMYNPLPHFETVRIKMEENQ